MPKISTARAPRVRMDLKLFINGKVVLRTTKFVRTRVIAYVLTQPTGEWDSGTIKVVYNKPEEYWNAGDFKTVEELQELLSQFTEWPLLQEYAL